MVFEYILLIFLVVLGTVAVLNIMHDTLHVYWMLPARSPLNLKACPYGIEHTHDKNRQVQIIACGSDTEKSQLLAKSVAKHAADVPFRNCCEGKVWHGFQDKIYALFDAAALLEHDNDIIVMLDAYDVLVLPTSKAEILSIANFIHAPLWVSACSYPYPDTREAFVSKWLTHRTLLDHKSSSFAMRPHLCSGVVAGTKHGVRLFQQYVESTGGLNADTDDQYLLQEYAMAFPLQCYVDHGAYFSLSCSRNHDQLIWQKHSKRCIVQPECSMPPFLHIEMTTNNYKADHINLANYIVHNDTSVLTHWSQDLSHCDAQTDI